MYRPRPGAIIGGAVGAGTDARQIVWVKAIDENGRTTIHTTTQLKSLDYRAEVRNTDQVVLTHGRLRLDIRANGTVTWKQRTGS